MTKCVSRLEVDALVLPGHVRDKQKALLDFVKHERGYILVVLNIINTKGS